MKQNLQQRKLSIIESVAKTNNMATIKKVENALADNYHASEEEIKSIKRGLDDVKNGRTKPHSEARKMYAKWLKK